LASLEDFSIEVAADLVALATAPSVAVRTAPKSLSVKVFPPNTKAKTTAISMTVRGKAIIGELSHIITSSRAAIPSSTSAQVGIDAE